MKLISIIIISLFFLISGQGVQSEEMVLNEYDKFLMAINNAVCKYPLPIESVVHNEIKKNINLPKVYELFTKGSCSGPEKNKPCQYLLGDNANDDVSQVNFEEYLLAFKETLKNGDRIPNFVIDDDTYGLGGNVLKNEKCLASAYRVFSVNPNIIRDEIRNFKVSPDYFNRLLELKGKKVIATVVARGPIEGRESKVKKFKLKSSPLSLQKIKQLLADRTNELLESVLNADDRYSYKYSEGKNREISLSIDLSVREFSPWSQSMVTAYKGGLSKRGSSLLVNDIFNFLSDKDLGGVSNSNDRGHKFFSPIAKFLSKIFALYKIEQQEKKILDKCMRNLKQGQENMKRILSQIYAGDKNSKLVADDNRCSNYEKAKKHPFYNGSSGSSAESEEQREIHYKSFLYDFSPSSESEHTGRASSVK